jgi:hypothetical protein
MKSNLECQCTVLHDVQKPGTNAETFLTPLLVQTAAPVNRKPPSLPVTSTLALIQSQSHQAVTNARQKSVEAGSNDSRVCSTSSSLAGIVDGNDHVGAVDEAVDESKGASQPLAGLSFNLLSFAIVAESVPAHGAVGEKAATQRPVVAVVLPHG